MTMKLTVTKTTYGKSEREVIRLNYHNGGDMPMFEIVGSDVWVEVFERIQLAQQKGCEIIFEGFEKYKDQFNRL